MGARRWPSCARVLRNPSVSPILVFVEENSRLHSMMGKNAGTWKRESEPLLQPLASFFPPSVPGLGKATGTVDGDKMVPPEAGEEPS